jgi:hypothetical protein
MGGRTIAGVSYEIFSVRGPAESQGCIGGPAPAGRVGHFCLVRREADFLQKKPSRPLEVTFEIYKTELLIAF